MPKKDLALANEIMLSAPKQSVDLFDMENLESMSYSEFKEKKDTLALLRQKVMLQVDGRKLQQTIKVMNAMDNALDRMLDLSIDEDGIPCVPSAKELDLYASTLKKLAETLRLLGRLDTIDGYGTPKELHLEVRFG